MVGWRFPCEKEATLGAGREVHGRRMTQCHTSLLGLLLNLALSETRLKHTQSHRESFCLANAGPLQGAAACCVMEKSLRDTEESGALSCRHRLADLALSLYAFTFTVIFFFFLKKRGGRQARPKNLLPAEDARLAFINFLIWSGACAKKRVFTP